MRYCIALFVYLVFTCAVSVTIRTVWRQSENELIQDKNTKSFPNEIFTKLTSIQIDRKKWD